MRGRQTSLSIDRPDWGLNLTPRHVPWPGIEPATLRFVG